MFRELSRVVLVVFSLMLVVACGGGGGGGGGVSDTDSGDNNTPASSVYSGLETQADLSSSNTEDFSERSTMGYESANSIMGTFGKSASEEGAGEFTGLNFFTVNTLKDILSDENYGRASYSDSSTVYGTCGGSASASFTINDDNSFSMSLMYDDFCYANVNANGGVSISGRYSGSSLSWTTLESVSVTYNSLNMRVLSTDVVASGTLSIAMSSSNNYTITSNLSFNDSAAGISFKNENLVVTVTESSDVIYVDSTPYTRASSLSMNGRLYLNEYGYVDITTITPVSINSGGQYLQGQIKIQGSNSKSALITYSPYSVQTVTGDYDGDEVYEFAF